jgi:hypothetical protein
VKAEEMRNEEERGAPEKKKCHRGVGLMMLSVVGVGRRFRGENSIH